MTSVFNSTETSLLVAVSWALLTVVCITATDDDDDDDDETVGGCGWYQAMFTGLPATTELTDAAYTR